MEPTVNLAIEPVYYGVKEALKKSDRRKYKRLNAKFLFEYNASNKKKCFGKRYVALTENISASGLIFRSAYLFQIGSMLTGILEIPELRKKIDISGRVIRLEPTRKEDIYEVAIQYIEIDNADRELINEFIKWGKPVSRENTLMKPQESQASIVMWLANDMLEKDLPPPPLLDDKIISKLTKGISTSWKENF